MKRAGALVVVALLTTCHTTTAQTRYGTVFLNNYDSSKGLFEAACFNPVPAGTFVEVLGGSDAGTLALIAPTSPAIPAIYRIREADRNALGPGTGSFFDYGFGVVYGVLPGAPAVFQVRMWNGTLSYDVALNRDAVTWTQQTGTNPDPPELPRPAVLQMPRSLGFPTAGPGWVAASPSSQIVPAGANVIFSLPLGSFHYQWRKDGLDLNGATNAMLSLTNVWRANAGVYDALVTWSTCHDSFFCQPATLRVMVPQRFEAPMLLSDARVQLTFRDQDTAVPPLPYATNHFGVQASTNLMDWQTVSGSFSLTNGFMMFEEASALNSRTRFYRIVDR